MVVHEEDEGEGGEETDAAGYGTVVVHSARSRRSSSPGPSGTVVLHDTVRAPDGPGSGTVVLHRTSEGDAGTLRVVGGSTDGLGGTEVPGEGEGMAQGECAELSADTAEPTPGTHLLQTVCA